MAIAVHNISATSARVSWASAAGCLDTFYSIMYHPNWNSLLMGYTRKSFLREHRVPASQTSTHLANLAPQTTYILCVTCQTANPGRDQCQVFSTLGEGGGAGQGVPGWELAMCVWLASCILLLGIAALLLLGCLHSIFPFLGHAHQGCPGEAAGSLGFLTTPSSSEDESKQDPPAAAKAGGGGGGAAGHELGALSGQSGGERVQPQAE